MRQPSTTTTTTTVATTISRILTCFRVSVCKWESAKRRRFHRVFFRLSSRHTQVLACVSLCTCVRRAWSSEKGTNKRTAQHEIYSMFISMFNLNVYECVLCMVAFRILSSSFWILRVFSFFLFRFEQFYYFLLLLCFARPSKSDTRTKTTKKERKNTHEIRRSVCTVDWLDRKVKKTSESNKTKPKNTQINKFRISDKWKLKIKNWYRTRSVCCTLTIVYFDCVKPEEENEIIVCGIGGACWTSIRLSEAANWCTLRQRATPSTVRVVARNDFFGQMQIKV